MDICQKRDKTEYAYEEFITIISEIISCDMRISRFIFTELLKQNKIIYDCTIDKYCLVYEKR